MTAEELNLRNRVAELEAERDRLAQERNVAMRLGADNLAAARARLAALEAERDAHIQEINQLRLDRASIST